MFIDDSLKLIYYREMTWEENKQFHLFRLFNAVRENEVDKDMLPFLYLINKLENVVTLFCCQGHFKEEVFNKQKYTHVDEPYLLLMLNTRGKNPIEIFKRIKCKSKIQLSSNEKAQPINEKLKFTSQCLNSQFNDINDVLNYIGEDQNKFNTVFQYLHSFTFTYEYVLKYENDFHVEYATTEEDLLQEYPYPRFKINFPIQPLDVPKHMKIVMKDLIDFNNKKLTS